MNAPLAVPKNLPSPALQRLWFATLKQPWSSLVVVPAHSGQSTVPLARGLAQVASLLKDTPIKLLLAEGADLQHASQLVLELHAQVAAGGLAIVVLDPVVGNPAGIPIALAADATLLCIELGETDFESVERTVELLAGARILGAVAVARRG